MTRNKTVLVDMDGVLADYTKGWQGLENIGDPIPGARDFLEELIKIAKVTIFTTRCHKSNTRTETHSLNEMKAFVTEWLHEHNMPYDEVYVGQGKPYCAAIVDDRAVNCNPQMLHGYDEDGIPPASYKLAWHNVCRLLGVEV